MVDAANHVVIPGMHNAHLHSGLLRGTAESLALFDCLENSVDPAHRALTPEIAKAASCMAYTECLRGGTSSVLDMWRFMQGSAEAAEQIGIRATLAPYTADRYDYFESLESNRRLLETYRTAAGGRVRRLLVHGLPPTRARSKAGHIAKGVLVADELLSEAPHVPSDGRRHAHPYRQELVNERERRLVVALSAVGCGFPMLPRFLSRLSALVKYRPSLSKLPIGCRGPRVGWKWRGARACISHRGGQDVLVAGDDEHRFLASRN